MSVAADLQQTSSAEAIAADLAAVLRDITAANELVPPDADLVSDSFGAIGLNSVDYLEFVLNIESRLNIDVPDEALMDPALKSVLAWADWLAVNAERLRTPDLAAR
ncbi:phosphopantetheine-binding protein [Mangrovicella endophytica]|uniref:phosphopantetheine-binding protein n=1 Tax=Mangrovicella endophytica TaxID=2066697 RepID=UPI000C9E9CA3|nr:phosphopantetheine-binding protein [Mangrovicella endophytica]